MTAALEGGEWTAARPGHTLHTGKTRYPFYRRLGGPQGRSGRAENLVPLRDSIPDRPARSSVAIPTELPGPHCMILVHESARFSFSCKPVWYIQGTVGLVYKLHCTTFHLSCALLVCYMFRPFLRLSSGMSIQ